MGQHVWPRSLHMFPSPSPKGLRHVKSRRRFVMSGMRLGWGWMHLNFIAPLGRCVLIQLGLHVLTLELLQPITASSAATWLQPQTLSALLNTYDRHCNKCRTSVRCSWLLSSAWFISLSQLLSCCGSLSLSSFPLSSQHLLSHRGQKINHRPKKRGVTLQQYNACLSSSVELTFFWWVSSFN